MSYLQFYNVAELLDLRWQQRHLGLWKLLMDGFVQRNHALLECYLATIWELHLPC